VAAMQQLFWKKMNKELYILKNVCITKNKVICDGQILFSDNTSTNFKSFSKSLYRKLGCDYSKFFKMDNLCKLTFLVNEIITRDIDLRKYNPNDIAILLSNSSSTFETDSIFANTLESIPSPAVFVYTLPNIAVGEISIRMGWKGENLFLVEDKFSPENLVEQVEMLYFSSQTKLCLTGWTDFISSSDYFANLWLVTNVSEADSKIFSPLELHDKISI
jgi:hypothetical protein